jgi:hypothetical protein
VVSSRSDFFLRRSRALKWLYSYPPYLYSPYSYTLANMDKMNIIHVKKVNINLFI